MPKTELFVGNLDRDVQRKEIEDVFEKYGKILRCDIKNRGQGAAYCFLEFEEERDAEDALNAENGKDLNGNQMHVEFAKSRPGGGGGGYRGGRDGGRDRYGGRGSRDGGRDRDFNGRNNFSRRDDRDRDRDHGRSSRGSRGGGRGCFECGQEGHFARDCPSSRGGDRRHGGGSSRSKRDSGRSRSRSPNGYKD